MRYLLILSMIIFTGCASKARFTDPQGNVWTARVNGLAESELSTPEGLKLKIKRQPLIKIPDLQKIDLSREE